MEMAQHSGKGLHYVTLRPDDYDPSLQYPLVILLHGFGANMFDLAGLAPALDRRGYVYACPNAPTPIAVGPGVMGYGWTSPQRFSDPVEGQRAQGLVDEFVEEVMEGYGTAAGRLVLGGFSQGAGLVYRCGLGRPELYAGLVALSGAVSDVEQLGESLPPERNQPLFIAHGLHDPMVPVERARQTLEFLEGAGYSPEYHEYPIGHEISQGLLDDLAPWLHRVLPPGGPPAPGP